MHNRACLLALVWMYAAGGLTLSGASQQAGVIVGRILDKDNEPFARATVEALVSRTGSGPPRFVSLASARTDDRGEFRLTGLPTGEIYVRAVDPAFTRVGDEQTEPRQYSATYYPGVVAPGRATRIAVTSDPEPPPIVFKLQTVRLARVSGVIRTSDGRQLRYGSGHHTPPSRRLPGGVAGAGRHDSPGRNVHVPVRASRRLRGPGAR